MMDGRLTDRENTMGSCRTVAYKSSRGTYRLDANCILLFTKVVLMYIQAVTAVVQKRSANNLH